MNARYYVPSLGRFASADTIVPDPTNPQQFNRFAYVLNNPIRLTDPSGHDCYDTSGGEMAGTCMDGEDKLFRFRQTVLYMHSEMLKNASSSHTALIHGMLELGRQIPSTLITTAYLLWAERVAPSRPWDHKPKLDQMLGLKEDNDYYFPIEEHLREEWYYDIWSNIHYGYVGSVAGFGEQTLQNGGSVPILAGNNDHADILSTQIGINLWKEYGLSLTVDQLASAIISSKDMFLTIQNEYPRELDRVISRTNGR